VKTDSIKTQSGGLPERHKAHLSWPPIVTNTITQNQFTAKCKVQGAKGTNVHKSVMSVHTVVNKNAVRLLLNTGVDWISFRLSGNLFHMSAHVEARVRIAATNGNIECDNEYS